MSSGRAGRAGSGSAGAELDTAGLRVAVVGHVEFVEFVSVAHLPAAGEVVNGEGAFQRAGGGGGVSAGMLAETGAQVELFTAFGDDELGGRAVAQLREAGVTVHTATRASTPTRRAITLLAAGERSIVTIGKRLAPAGDDALPWDRLERTHAVYFTAGDAAARATRAVPPPSSPPPAPGRCSSRAPGSTR